MLQTNLQSLLDVGGPSRCIRHGKATGKIPKEVGDEGEAVSFYGEDEEVDTKKLCIDKIGPRFPLSHFSYSVYDTDAFWRGILSGGIDLFYAINEPPVYDAIYSDTSGNKVPSSLKALAAMPGKFHTFFEETDRIAIMPNPDSTDPDFANESPQCLPYKDMVKYNSEYDMANIHDPKWGAQNTAYVYGLVKGAWGFRGITPIDEWPPGLPRSRYPDIKVRFR